LDNKFKVGIIGAGTIVESSHIPVLKVLPGVSIEWVYDRDQSRSELLSKMFHVPVLKKRSVESAVDDIDICLLTIPYGARKEYIELCAKKKKGLYVEKPFAVSIKEHKEYCEWFAPYNLAIGFQRRNYRVVQLLKNIINANIFGKLINISFKQGYFTLKGNKEFLSNATLSGGGVIIESAIHILDQILLITNSETLIVKEVSSLQKMGIDYDTFFDTELSNKENKIQVDIEISTLRNLDNGVRFIFENAEVSCDMSPDEKIRIFDCNGKPLFLDIGLLNVSENERNGAKSVTAAFYFFWSDFLQAVVRKTTNETSAINSLLTTGWIEQIYKKINNT
jgi:predicted dehydrogenase